MRPIRALGGTAMLVFVMAGSLAAQQVSQASKPKDATGQCTDGSYTTAKTQARGCLKHGGVKTWYESAAAAPSAKAPATPAANDSSASTARPKTKPPTPTTPAAAPAQAPAHPSDVWVNLTTKAYHCPGTKYYGSTKQGKYMSEADAKAAGFHASHGKACGS